MHQTRQTISPSEIDAPIAIQPPPPTPHALRQKNETAASLIKAHHHKKLSPPTDLSPHPTTISNAHTCHTHAHTHKKKRVQHIVVLKKLLVYKKKKKSIIAASLPPAYPVRESSCSAENTGLYVLLLAGRNLTLRANKKSETKLRGKKCTK